MTDASEQSAADAMQRLTEIFSKPDSRTHHRCCTDGPRELDVVFESIIDELFGFNSNSEYKCFVKRLYRLGLIPKIPGEWEQAEKCASAASKTRYAGAALTRNAVNPGKVAPQAIDPEQRERTNQPTGELEPERRAAGEQHVLPDAERISEAELAKRRAEQPLKPKVKQKPADEGLFSDESKQAGLFD